MFLTDKHCKSKIYNALDKMELDKIVENYIFDLNNEFAFTMIKERKNKT
jgi:hypothetical protein